MMVLQVLTALTYVKYFASHGFVSRHVGATNITLIPKEGTTTIKDFWPITLATSFYKIDTKLLAEHLKKVMNSIISWEQAAFIPIRQILDVAMTVDEVVDNLHKSRQSAFLLKLDLENALDRTLVCIIPNYGTDGLPDAMEEMDTTMCYVRKILRQSERRKFWLLQELQFLPVFNNQSLMGFVDGSIQPPHQYSTADTSTVTSKYIQCMPSTKRSRVRSSKHCPMRQLEKQSISLAPQRCGSSSNESMPSPLKFD
ncbi:hypothetical protein H6P81_010074 [Aristolochia fimbriata]|uniref:Reverse transcriptase domain-containing protein n=1 Tax=Aristolochia fimbriata TaxID=158543 RepID=A0AAV7ENC6_ARIFI|nr:hypothetical protein H6P81_010074 [Aristolochia fimbriata]